jgi:hypothetical protein
VADYRPWRLARWRVLREPGAGSQVSGDARNPVHRRHGAARHNRGGTVVGRLVVRARGRCDGDQDRATGSQENQRCAARPSHRTRTLKHVTQPSSFSYSEMSTGSSR